MSTIPAQPAPLVNQVRRELRALPNYGVFDLLTFQMREDGTVQLGGYVVRSSLRKDAQKEVEDVKGVTKVESTIEVAPTSIADDELRMRLFRAIYRDPFLSRYGTADDQMFAGRARLSPWGDGFRTFSEFGAPRWTQAPFYGREPIGTYAIHILVKHGVVTLAGQVDSERDKTAAGQKAKMVFGVMTLYNDLHVGGVDK
jgi:hypothetical protein